MPEPISTTLGVWCIGYAALHGYAHLGTALSDEASVAASRVSSIVTAAEGSDAMFGKKKDLLSRLCLALDEHASSDTDDVTVGLAAIENARDFIVALPDDLPSPEFAIEPDGSIEIDWIAGRSQVFSMSVGSGNRIAYAWLLGTDKGRGVARFDGVSVPDIICHGVKMVMGIRDASIRAA